MKLNSNTNLQKAINMNIQSSQARASARISSTFHLILHSRRMRGFFSGFRHIQTINNKQES